MVVPGRKGIDILVQEIRACVAYSSSLEEKKRKGMKSIRILSYADVE
jgi:hypothetical protein